jgi:hypothetical protein
LQKGRFVREGAGATIRGTDRRSVVLTPAEAQDVLERCRIGVFVAQSFAVGVDRGGYEELVDTAHVRGALDELRALLPLGDDAVDDCLRCGCDALLEATGIVERNAGGKMHRRERRRVEALDRAGAEHLSAALSRLSALAELGALPVRSSG